MLQRSIEICFAFYNDVLSIKPKQTNLTNTTRVKLAINSIIEIILLSISIYSLISIYNEFEVFEKHLKENSIYFLSEVINIIFNSTLKSIAVSLFNISYNWEGLSSIIHLLQVFISIILITLSVANYLNMKKEVYFYIVEYEKNKFILKYYRAINSNQFVDKEICDGYTLVQLEQSIEHLWRNTTKLNEYDFEEILDVIKSDDVKRLEQFSNIFEVESYWLTAVKRYRVNLKQ
ncbi:hypothetical protein Q75_15710 [Bacillus coahuilensis p1.1.43]|uniref:Uncharacterized protein n=1 Tax=Bacillus coahuilensis p1.1.43 TaxID=1150625 RepID=A0A147K4R1_9BACI|nr:hypothetical protein [Bacillus coahuilensis]KUP04433.1 hypothetical protein Q75_15710 [Bacillus coahuilensis p1.1.43]